MTKLHHLPTLHRPYDVEGSQLLVTEAEKRSLSVVEKLSGDEVKQLTRRRMPTAEEGVLLCKKPGHPDKGERVSYFHGVIVDQCLSAADASSATRFCWMDYTDIYLARLRVNG
jgi:hypothetical protein